MSQLTKDNAPIGRYSKRKRATVNYFIDDSENEEEQGDDYSEEVVEHNPAKVCHTTFLWNPSNPEIEAGQTSECAT